MIYGPRPPFPSPPPRRINITRHRFSLPPFGTKNEVTPLRKRTMLPSRLAWADKKEGNLRHSAKVSPRLFFFPTSSSACNRCLLRRRLPSPIFPIFYPPSLLPLCQIRNFVAPLIPQSRLLFPPPSSSTLPRRKGGGAQESCVIESWKLLAVSLLFPQLLPYPSLQVLVLREPFIRLGRGRCVNLLKRTTRKTKD